MAKAKKELVYDIQPCYDRERHTILKIGSIDGTISYIPLDINDGLRVLELKEAKFNEIYKTIPNYPIKKACELFANYAKTLGATKQVVKILSTVVNFTEEDIKLAIEKREIESNVAPPKPVVEKKLKVVKPERAKSLPKQPSAAQMFKDLILAGKLTDEQIFKEVQDNFGIDDSKKSYVKWYRSNLKKSGLDVPEPVEPKTKGKSK